MAALAGQARGGRELNPCMSCPEALHCWLRRLASSQLFVTADRLYGRPDSTDSVPPLRRTAAPCRHDECRNVIEERYGEKAAHWVQAMLHFSRKTEGGLKVSPASTLQGPAAVMDLQPSVAGSSMLQHFLGAESLPFARQSFLQ